MRTLLADTAVLVASARLQEPAHADAVRLLEAHAAHRIAVPVSILAEAMGLLGSRDGIHHQRLFWDAFMKSGIEIVAVDRDLIEMARDIDRAYADAGFGFADCTLLAACEALRCGTVLSFDRRLALYRPSFAKALTVLP